MSRYNVHIIYLGGNVRRNDAEQQLLLLLLFALELDARLDNSLSAGERHLARFRGDDSVIEAREQSPEEEERVSDYLCIYKQHLAFSI